MIALTDGGFEVTHYSVQLFSRNWVDITDKPDNYVANLVMSLFEAGWFVKLTEHNNRKYLRYGA